LVGTQKDIGACKGVIDGMKKDMCEIVVDLKKSLIKISSLNKKKESVDIDDKRKMNKAIDTKNPKNIFEKIVISTQVIINAMFKKVLVGNVL